ncbi:hypothetical protein B0W47_02655 [Komagataeibacter nataicola]|uniref:DUF1178 domain-containing protein n=1 Tax=Komagataeibacter nataicola TaxID=265960 RepID=A0A9N7H040_9PROT|nr:DUF1178 family protein [Komagataeibacter nataicola]AQU86537.1 hypothetical protein B0W47_02655 [Komagataeibacter nataicola]PYD66352.1 hypothetical protein CDI09_08620 [Komagataeibacter nataicola]WEQ56569.1 DUF1178 family protein [Komagataeibacter nataicola]WNM08064.1 DUF1178 family protein [Komagataeibacter nataicola]GBR22155.1 hypothetical protein AA0616_2207 [Komagataeibacter nataicola NRIC 0616]
MIRYQLRCGAGHEFEGWFPGSAAFERQAAGGLLSCPHCGSPDVTRALMAPAVHTGMPARQVKETATPATPTPPGHAPQAMPDTMVALLQKIRDTVEAQCDDVGDRFAEEALGMHRGEREARGIYGSMTEQEHAELDEAGVEVHAIPWVRRADS